MEPYRAFISDRLPKSQLARGFLTQSMFTGAGAVLASAAAALLVAVSDGSVRHKPQAELPYHLLDARRSRGARQRRRQAQRRVEGEMFKHGECAG